MYEPAAKVCFDALRVSLDGSEVDSTQMKVVA
jgi:hypothetical protein